MLQITYKDLYYQILNNRTKPPLGLLQGEKMHEGFSDSGVPNDTPVQVAKVNRTLLAVREMKAASNIVAWGLDKNHVIMDKRTGKVIYEGGEDVVISKRSKAVTKIIDNGKDYVINM